MGGRGHESFAMWEDARDLGMVWRVSSSERPRAGPEHSPTAPAHPQVGFSMVPANPLTRGQWSWQRTSWISMVSDWRLWMALSIQPLNHLLHPQISPLPPCPWKFCSSHSPGQSAGAHF